MIAINLKLGQKVIVSFFGPGSPVEIETITRSEDYPGYLIFGCKGVSKIIHVPYDAKLSLWDTIPVLV